MANSFVATAGAGVSWMLIEWLVKGRPSLLGLASGVVAGLVAVTPASGYAGPMGALILGLSAGVVCFFFVTVVKNIFGYDDTLDVFGVHAVGGTLGAIATGILVNPAYGGAGIVDYATCKVVAGVFTSDCGQATYDMATQVKAQLKAVGLSIAWSTVGSLIVYSIIWVITGLRVAEEKEREGLDITEHGERAYNL
jgi:ammonium transporter, Amt family